MEQKEIYELIKRRNNTVQNMLVTVVSGNQIGNKAFISNNDIYSLNDSKIFKENLEAFFNVPKQEVLVDENRLFIETIGNQKKLVICGGGHVANAIVKTAKNVGFEVTVIEDRPKFADEARLSGADTVICDDFLKGLETIEGDNDTYFVIVTRGHRYDRECLIAISDKPSAYIGMMGSKGRIKQLKASLLEDNELTQEKLDKLHSPIGIYINAETPTEIAISIVAELIQIKNTSARYDGYGKEMINALSGYDEFAGKQVLATIVTRKGSAPRAKGTKMIIRDNGTIVGTIGGGCMESEVIRKAQFMMATANGDTKPEIVFVDMTGRDAEAEGMACGGVIEVLLELL